MTPFDPNDPNVLILCPFYSLTLCHLNFQHPALSPWAWPHGMTNGMSAEVTPAGAKMGPCTCRVLIQFLCIPILWAVLAKDERHVELPQAEGDPDPWPASNPQTYKCT